MAFNIIWDDLFLCYQKFPCNLAKTPALRKDDKEYYDKEYSFVFIIQVRFDVKYFIYWK